MQNLVSLIHLRTRTAPVVILSYTRSSKENESPTTADGFVVESSVVIRIIFGVSTLYAHTSVGLEFLSVRIYLKSSA